LTYKILLGILFIFLTIQNETYIKRQKMILTLQGVSRKSNKVQIQHFTKKKKQSKINSPASKQSKGYWHHPNNPIETFTTLFFSDHVDKYLTLSNKWGIDFSLLLKIVSFLSCQITQNVATHNKRVKDCRFFVPLDK